VPYKKIRRRNSKIFFEAAGYKCFDNGKGMSTVVKDFPGSFDDKRTWRIWSGKANGSVSHFDKKALLLPRSIMAGPLPAKGLKQIEDVENISAVC